MNNLEFLRSAINPTQNPALQFPHIVEFMGTRFAVASDAIRVHMVSDPDTVARVIEHHGFDDSPKWEAEYHLAAERIADVCSPFFAPDRAERYAKFHADGGRLFVMAEFMRDRNAYIYFESRGELGLDLVWSFGRARIAQRDQTNKGTNQMVWAINPDFLYGVLGCDNEVIPLVDSFTLYLPYLPQGPIAVINKTDKRIAVIMQATLVGWEQILEDKI